MNILKKIWSIKKDIEPDLDFFIEENIGELKKALKYIGSEFVANARKKTKIKSKNKVYPHAETGFYDHTGNLRSSIGYLIEENGKEYKKKFNKVADGDVGKDKGVESAKKIAEQYNGLVLCVVAGMEYGLYVESKGYDVISSSKPTRSEVEEFFKELSEAE